MLSLSFEGSTSRSFCASEFCIIQPPASRTADDEIDVVNHWRGISETESSDQDDVCVAPVLAKCRHTERSKSLSESAGLIVCP